VQGSCKRFTVSAVFREDHANPFEEVDMIELAFVACLSAAPAACEKRSLYYADDLSPTACVLRAQPELAKWIFDHPRYHVASWSCRFRAASEQDA
jgi:hypothetical protein